MEPVKIHGHVKQALGRLYNCGWEIKEVIEVTDWWASHVWKFTSNKQAFGTELFITPLSDRLSNLEAPMHIELVRASSVMPIGFYETKGVIAECYMGGRGLEKRLDEFVAEIENFRNNK
jgi:hypothetical protein